ncbi:MAG: beta-CASP ribonuclease aCPSF1 [Candidatus Woesearchaeota archaeon]|nr:beta-CASP ribonuclease aCPSF1 [Candidatus Woesearchaeota archaeon]
MPADIIKEIMKIVPEEKISDVAFEAANIVLYTKNKGYFLDDKETVRKAVNTVKKRIELRPDPSMCVDQETTEKLIHTILTAESGVDQIVFDPERSVVYIEVENPGIAIANRGALINKVKEETLWMPVLKRKPPIKSQLIENIRSVLYENSEYRRKFLHKAGERIYNGWQKERKEEWVRITYLGGGRQVGRSAIFLQTPESRVLFDCGVDPASDDHAYPYLEAPEFRLEELDAIVISHAHLDHTGFLPYLFKYGYRGPVYCTEPTRDIMSLLQLDLIKIARDKEEDAIYSVDEVREVVKHTVTLDLESVTDITPDVRITFYNAGHILGSAMVHIHVGNGLHNILYTADIKYAKTHMLAPSHTKFPRVETMLIESTYGGKDNVVSNSADDEFARFIINTMKRGGKVLMPTLGSGRAQEVVVLIEKLIKQKKIPKDVPIYLDGMLWDIMAIHTAYPEFLNSSLRQRIFHKEDNPFLAENIKRVGSAKERKQIVEEGEPCIIIATSGMLTGGPSVFYLQELCADKRNALVFSCYQAEGTLGRQIQAGVSEFSITTGRKVEAFPIKLEIFKIEISGHSDRRELMNFVKNCSPRPRKVLVNHGEISRCLDFARSLHQQFRIETICPRNLDCLRLR